MTQRNPDMDMLHHQLMQVRTALYAIGNIIDRENPPTFGLREAYAEADVRLTRATNHLDEIIPGGCPDSGR